MHTRDNTHASAQKIQLYVWRYVIPGFYVGAGRFTAFGDLGGGARSFAMSLLRDGTQDEFDSTMSILSRCGSRVL